MYENRFDIDLEILNDNGFIESLHYDNVTYVCFKFYNVSIFIKDTKQILCFQNVLSINITKK